MENEIFNQLIQFGMLKTEDSSHELPFLILRSSEVFEGHFPNQPILPGVAMIELVQRAAELVLQENLKLKSAGNFKFLMMMDPEKVTEASFNFSILEKEDGWRVKGQIKNNEGVFFKADAFYVRQ